MTDDYTVSRWGPEPPPINPAIADLWKRCTGALANTPTRIESITTAPVGPLKAPDLGEMHRIAEQAIAARPEWDRFAMNQSMAVTVALIAGPAPHQYGGPLSGMSFGTPIVLDEGLPYGVIEVRDGDRVVKQIIYTPEERHDDH